LKDAIQLIFNDASKTISDLKLRQWSATNLAILGIVGIATFSRDCTSKNSQCMLTLFVLGIYAAHFFVMFRCESNLNKFRSRLRSIREMFPAKAYDLFGIVDEGTIVFIAYVSVGIASVFAGLAIWRCFT
jgi:hypothetical protein